jgi:hypothetical protein
MHSQAQGLLCFQWMDQTWSFLSWSLGTYANSWNKCNAHFARAPLKHPMLEVSAYTAPSLWFRILYSIVAYNISIIYYITQSKYYMQLWNTEYGIIEMALYMRSLPTLDGSDLIFPLMSSLTCLACLSRLHHLGYPRRFPAQCPGQWTRSDFKARSLGERPKMSSQRSHPS